MTQDLIDREALLNQLEETYNYICIYNDNNDFSCGLREGIHIAISRTNELPSVKIETKKSCSDCQEFDCYGCQFKSKNQGDTTYDY